LLAGRGGGRGGGGGRGDFRGGRGGGSSSYYTPRGRPATEFGGEPQNKNKKFNDDE